MSPPGHKYTSNASRALASLVFNHTRRRALEDLLRELEGWKPQETDGALAQRRIEELDKALFSLETGSSLWIAVLRRLQATCRRAKRLPEACYLSNEPSNILDTALQKEGTPSSTVYLISRGQASLAYKVLRGVASHSGSDTVQRGFYDEVIAWRWLRHPNIVPFIGVSRTCSLCIISQWMMNEHVLRFIRKRPHINRLSLVKDMICGLDYMHCLRITHGDLKSTNVLVNDKGTACLADFGITSLNTESHTVLRADRGTVPYMAPERLQHLEMVAQIQEPAAEPTKEADIYALALVMWEVFAGKAVFEGMHQLQVKAYVIQGGRPGLPLSLGPSRIGFSTEIWEAMKQCWSVDCALRTQGMNNLLRVVELVSWSQKGNYSRFRKITQRLSRYVPSAPRWMYDGASQAEVNAFAPSPSGREARISYEPAERDTIGAHPVSSPAAVEHTQASFPAWPHLQGLPLLVREPWKPPTRGHVDIHPFFSHPSGLLLDLSLRMFWIASAKKTNDLHVMCVHELAAVPVPSDTERLQITCSLLPGWALNYPIHPSDDHEELAPHPCSLAETDEWNADVVLLGRDTAGAILRAVRRSLLEPIDDDAHTEIGYEEVCDAYERRMGRVACSPVTGLLGLFQSQGYSWVDGLVDDVVFDGFVPLAEQDDGLLRLNLMTRRPTFEELEYLESLPG